MKYETRICDNCGKQFQRYIHLKPMQHVFCCRACSRAYLSRRMTQMNKELNPTRMNDFKMREAVREGRLRNNTGNEHCYKKLYGVHEHRILAELKLGRDLLPGEVVHHIDGNPRNNDLSNIEVLSSQAEHARFHNFGKGH